MKKIASLLSFLCFVSFSLAQDCPVVLREGNLLRVAQPTGGKYQWFFNGSPIPGATAETYIPAVDGDYTVEVYGVSPVKNVWPLNSNRVRVVVAGQTLNRKLEPVAGVAVTIDNVTVFSDEKGQFRFPQLLVKKGRIAVKYHKAGYFAAGQGLDPMQKGEIRTVVCLVEHGKPARFKPAEGITAKNGSVQVTIEPNSVQLNGQPYNGPVDFFMAAFSPDDPVYGLTMPGGDLLAMGSQNENLPLQSIGIVNVEMKTPDGELLNINPDIPATLDFKTPKIYKNQAASLEQIPLWYFDENQQIWLEEGVSEKRPNGRFVGKVKHFSWWNCDIPGAISYVKGCLPTVCTGQPAAYATVYFNEMSLIADSNGCFIKPIPALRTYHVSAGLDTLVVQTAQPADTLEITGLAAGFNIFAYAALSFDTLSLPQLDVFVGACDTTILTGLTYSIDGVSFQSSNHFSGFATMPDSVWVQSGACLSKYKVYAPLPVSFCVMLNDTSLANVTPFTQLSQALSAQAAGTPVYALDLSENIAQTNALFQKADVCPCLQKLAINKMQLSTLPSSIDQIENLQVLEAHENNFSAFPPQFWNLSHLKKINFAKNQFAALPPEIGLLSTLTEMNFYNNHLSALPAELGNLSELEVLEVSHNQLTALPSEIGALLQLKKLSIGANQIAALPVEIGNLTQLESISAYSNQLSGLPSQIVNLTNLTYLDLSNNLLSNIPPEIWSLSALNSLSLSENQISTLPSDVGALPNLKVLNVGWNLLTSLPAEVWTLTNLNELEIAFNQLSVLPADIGNLTLLVKLKMGGNQFSIIPQEVYTLTNLVNLGMELLPIDTLSHSIGNLSSLIQLDISNCQLSTLPEELWTLSDLFDLDLKGNQLTQIPPEIKNLVSLNYLNLSNNLLTNLPPEIGQLNQLIRLSLAGNQLTGLPAQICDLKDSIGPGPYNCGNEFYPCFEVWNNPAAAALEAQWDACP